jgi:hypothetical protein
MIVYQVQGTELLRIPTPFLKRMKGVYGWYIQRSDAQMLCPGIEACTSDQSELQAERIYLYIGTVTAGPRRSVAARFAGELLGSQICSDNKLQKFDTDFAVSCVIEFLSAKGINVFFDLISDQHGSDEEIKIARVRQPILQRIRGTRQLWLHEDVKRTITENNIEQEIEAVGPVVLRRLRERLISGDALVAARAEQ